MALHHDQRHRSPAADTLLMTFASKILLWAFWHRGEWGNGERSLQKISGKIYMNFPGDENLSTLLPCNVIFCMEDIQHSLESFLRYAPFYNATLLDSHPTLIFWRFNTTQEWALRNASSSHSKRLSIDCSLYTSVNDSFLLAWWPANSTSVTKNIITLIQNWSVTRGRAKCSQKYTVLWCTC